MPSSTRKRSERASRASGWSRWSLSVTERQDFCVTGDFAECGIKEAHGWVVHLADASES